MTKIKRLVAVALAFLMIFGSITVTASAWDAATDDGFDLNIKPRSSDRSTAHGPKQKRSSAANR